MYNTTALQGATSILDIFKYANDSTGSILFGSFMIAIFIVMLMILKRWEFDSALLTSSWLCFILSMFLAYSKLINIMFPLMFLALAAFTAFYMFVIKD